MPNLDLQHIKTISISRTREIRVGVALAEDSASAFIQKYEKDRDHPSCEMLPVGRQFYIFQRELRLVAKALLLAADALDIANPQPGPHR